MHALPAPGIIAMLGFSTHSKRLANLWRRRLPALWTSLVLSASVAAGCGGSGSPESNSVSSPLADAGFDQNVFKGEWVYLDGTKSRAGNGTPAFSWKQLSGEPVTLTQPAGVDPSFLAPRVLGDLVFELRVSDGARSDIDTVSVTVRGEEPPPVARKVQLHLHGHSNHNSAANPASMQWHSAWASESSAADVLWWSDHADMFDQDRAMTIEFSRGNVDAETLIVSGIQESPIHPDKSFTHLVPVVSTGTPDVSVSAEGLAVSLQSAMSTDWQFLDYVSKSAQTGPDGPKKVRNLVFNRPISSGATLQLEADIDPADPDTSVELIVDLAWHRSDTESLQHRVIYEFVSPENATSPEVLSNAEVRVTQPAVAGVALYEMNLFDAGLTLVDGDDNTISQITLRLGARNGKTVAAVFGRLELVSTLPARDNQFDIVEAFSDRYEARYGIVQHVGAEHHHPSQLHMNAFLPAGERVVDYLDDTTGDQETRNWVSAIHDAGGLISWNHPFGTSSWTQLAGDQDRLQRMRDAAESMLADQAFGADLLEVGYLNRGDMNLIDHLDLWDILLANRLFIAGIGVSDSHGGKWTSFQGPGAFTTWVLSESTGEAALLERLADGKAYFGNPHQWDGLFTLQAGDAFMGDIARIDADETMLEFRLEPWQEGTRLYLVQGLLSPAETVEYLHRRTEVIGSEPVAVDTTRSSFVRLEAYSNLEDISDRSAVVIITNPIVLLRD